MTSPGDDSDLEKYLSRDSELSRRYAATSTEEPPLALDDAVLARARAAVEAPSIGASRLPLRKHTRWTVPFAVAATVLLSFALFREAGMESDFMLEEGAAPVTAPAPAAAPTAVPTLSDSTETQVAEARREAPAQAKAAESVASAEANAAPAAQARALSVAPPAADRTRNETDTAQESRTPEAWLEEIRKFRADGEITAAEAQLKLFMEQYPDYFERNPEIARP